MPRKKQEKEVIDIQSTQQADEMPRCEITVGITEQGDVYFSSRGSIVDLVQIDGLVKYANRELDRQWSIRSYELAQLAQQRVMR